LVLIGDGLILDGLFCVVWISAISVLSSILDLYYSVILLSQSKVDLFHSFCLPLILFVGTVSGTVTCCLVIRCLP
jgi:hypothetical protein